MKKTLAVLLSVMMLFALCVPAFAVNGTVKNKLGEVTNDTVIKTSTTTESGEDAETYTVIIPAETTIAWGAASTAVEYTVEAHLGYGKVLKVDVADKDAAKLMTLADHAEETLAYDLTDTSYTSAGAVVNPAATVSFNVVITDDAWNNAIVGEYSDTLTFTAVAE